MTSSGLQKPYIKSMQRSMLIKLLGEKVVPRTSTSAWTTNHICDFENVQRFHAFETLYIITNR